MFEQLNITNKLKRQISKAVSIALSAAMLVTALPADLLGGVANVQAAEAELEITSVNFSALSATTYSEETQLGGSIFYAVKEGLSIDDGSLSDEYAMCLKVNGTIQKKGEKNAIKIVATGAGTLTGKAFNAAKKDERRVGLFAYDAIDTYIGGEDNTFVPTVDGNPNDFTLNIPKEGTYYLGSPVNGVSFYELSLEYDEPKSAPDGTADFTKLKAYAKEGKDTPKISGYAFDKIVYHNEHGLRTTEDNATIKVKLAKKSTVTVNLCTYGNCKVTASSGTPKSESWKEPEGDQLKDSIKWIVSGADAGDLTLTFEKSSTYIHSVEIADFKEGGEETDPPVTEDPDEPEGSGDGLDKPGQVGDKTWTFKVATADEAVLIQSETGKFAGLQIDATQGKLSVTTNQWAQFNTGTIIKVPVDGDCEIKVVGYGGDGGNPASEYKINGEEAIHTATDTYTYRGEVGYVNVVANNNSYISSISIKHIDPLPDEPEGSDDGLDKPGQVGDKTWTFKVDSKDDEVTIQGKKGKYAGLEIDATAAKAKFYVRTSQWAQFHTGTSIKVPVDGACEITVKGYSGTEYTVKDEDGKALDGKIDEQPFTYTGKAGYVYVVSDSDDGYIDSISVKHIELPFIEEGKYVFYGEDSKLSKEEDIKAVKGLSLEGTFAYGNKHGIQTKDDSKVTLDLAGLATIEVVTCCYGPGQASALTDTTSGTMTSVTAKEEGNDAYEYTIKNASGKTTLTFLSGSWVHSIAVTYQKEVDLDTTKPDVWDFGAMEVEGAYNLLNADIINGFYPAGTEAGSSGVSISSFEAKDSNDIVAIKFVTDKSNHRIRTSNKAITRYDEKTKTSKEKDPKDPEKSYVYEGFLYSNNTSTADSVANSLNKESEEAGRADHLDIYLYEGDTLTCMLGSNSNPANYKLYDPDNAEFAEFDFKNEYGVEAAVFHAGEEGWYKLYCTDEKLVCARIIRAHAPKVTVSGSIDTTKATGIPAGYGVVYTNKDTGKKTEMPVENGTYTGVVPGGYSYKVTLTKNANGYVVRGGKDLEVGTDKEAVTNNLTVETVDQKTISGKVNGLTDAELAKVKFEFEIPEDKVFEPEYEIKADASYTLKVENGVKYNVTAIDVNDSILKTTEISATADTTADINFEKKPTYAVTLKITGVENSSNAVVTFTNVDEKYSDKKTPYAYTFKASDEMKLRDGRYSVKVAGLGNYPVSQGITPNVNVKGAAVSDAPVPFNQLDGWDFAKLNDVIEIETIEEKSYYAGLQLDMTSATVQKNKIYLLANAGSTVTVPDLKEGDKVTVTYCYTAAFTLTEDGSTDGADVYGTGSGSAGTLESTEYTMKADGKLVISNTTGKFKYIDSKDNTEKERDVNQTYLCSIDVASKDDETSYSATIAVGKDKTYKTINEALEAVRKMDRTADQKVTIMIDPGDYEEMLVLDTPNVLLKNAAAKPSIALKNKGVDIDENAVRVTWYYGHGYTYYSMDTNCKYNAEVLAANKSNGYASFKNPGSGTTAGSYWNATVVVTADKVSAEGIIFENSFNQYMSKKATEDVIEKQSGAKELAGQPRANMQYGDTTVQNKAYVERAAALAIYNDKKEISFDNCKFIGRQDTLYGGTGVTAAFYNCSVYGGTDYIFGGMTAVFAKCDLVFNTMEDKNDVGYITAAQQTSSRGYLMWNCTVTSTTPGVDTASEYPSKPGYFGRPWQANTGEAVFYETIIEATCAQYAETSPSLILPIGWNSSLGGESALSQEYNTHEWAQDAKGQLDNSKNRAKWAKVMTDEESDDITVAAFLGDWNPFAGKNMKVEIPSGMKEGTSFDGWDKVAAPVIDKLYVSGDGNDKLVVKVTADVGDKGGETLKVTVKNAKDANDMGQTKSSSKKQNKHELVFTVPGPGTYEVTAVLKRRGQADKITTKKITVNSKGQVSVKEGLYVELLDDDPYVYTGSAIKPAIAVWNGDELLKEGTDYTVKYSNNVKASESSSPNSNTKKPTITVTGKGRFTGKTVQTFTIKQRDLEDVKVGGLSKEAADTLIVAENAKINPVLVYKGVLLKAKKDFTIDVTAKATASLTGTSITITGVNNYTGTRTFTLDVRKVKKITSVKVNTKAGYEYDGEEKNAPITEVKAGKEPVDADDYLIVYNGDKTSAGTQKFTIIGVGIYAGSKTSSFKINPRKVTTFVPEVDSSLMNGDTVTCTFNSAGVTFSDAITVTDTGLNGSPELVLGKDYKVTYSGNKKVGNAKYTVTFLGNYKGSKTALKNYTFKIEAANLKELEAAGELYAVAANKAYNKPAQYKSAPYVLVNGVALKKSDYKVTYYVGDSVMSNSNKVSLAEGETSKTVRVVIEGKKNYTDKVETEFEVESKAGKTDISKARITVNEKKKEYTGKAVYPSSISIKVGPAVTTLNYNTDTDSWLTTDGAASQDFDIEVVNNIAKGKATIIVTGTNNNVGSKTATYSVVSYNLAKVPESFWPDFSILSWSGLWPVR